MRHFVGQIQILLLLLFSPARLFQRINALDWYRAMLHAWVDALALQSRQRVLEVGCATGALTEYIAANGMAVTGIDASAAMIHRAQAQRPRRAEFLIGDATTLPFATDSFDAVLAASLLNIIATPDRLMRELARVCQPGGAVAVLVPQRGFGPLQIAQYIRANSLTGFSAAALRFWLQRVPKMSVADIEAHFLNVGIKIHTVTTHLNGMVVAVSGLKP